MYEQIKLPYSFDSLEKSIDSTTMETHYSKHHAAYTKNFNDLAEAAKVSDKSVEEVLASWKKDLADKPQGGGIRNNGGGFYNHNLYFGHLSPNGGKEPEGKLAQKISSTFGSFDAFKEEISKLAVGQFGSGWAWLSSDKNGNLKVSSSPNQDNPILETEGEYYPIFGIDVWEHAYYLKYKNLRASYVSAFFDVVDWNQVAKNYENAINRK